MPSSLPSSSSTAIGFSSSRLSSAAASDLRSSLCTVPSARATAARIFRLAMASFSWMLMVFFPGHWTPCRASVPKLSRRCGTRRAGGCSIRDHESAFERSFRAGARGARRGRPRLRWSRGGDTRRQGRLRVPRRRAEARRRRDRRHGSCSGAPAAAGRAAARRDARGARRACTGRQSSSTATTTSRRSSSPATSTSVRSRRARTPTSRG